MHGRKVATVAAGHTSETRCMLVSVPDGRPAIRSPMRLFLLGLVAVACQAVPCPDKNGKPTQPSEPPQEDRPACTLSREDASRRAHAWLAALAGTEALPDGLTVDAACVSHCLEPRDDVEDGGTCASWECGFRYGEGGHRDGSVPLRVHVVRCGERSFGSLGLAGCFARPHRCELRVGREQAAKLAAVHGTFRYLYLAWSSAAEEFQWIAEDDWRSVDPRELVRISAHDPGDIRPGPAANAPSGGRGSSSD
ncbi:hypothetical protein OV203_10670 [Nannocystis sp. ILAH1]|uniref:hypothetical protein n=1 Tax=Nannocystis sp. ILAH1 TaxID=2996789 RepID=UPI00226F90BD|nr:hypothetical protein [Nannocystis sp. ILAH1]MCY0987589.1 hypothetical protein [Nannocystis sp. ILAH1]